MGLLWIPGALFNGTVGAVSLCKAFHVERREIRCDCVGGDSNVLLGFVPLIENLMLIATAIWNLVKLMAFGTEWGAFRSSATDCSCRLATTACHAAHSPSKPPAPRAP